MLTVHVALCLSEFHFVHAFTSVPVQESLSAEHRGELLAHSLPDLLDGGGVAHEGGGHLESLRRDVANGRLHVVGNPLDEVGRVLVLNVQHLLVNLNEVKGEVFYFYLVLRLVLFQIYERFTHKANKIKTLDLNPFLCC